ncbi:MAG: hypothetical protein QMD10_11105 [Desulfitobacteriaceae bacterium]|nr:hypothetical protein [Desulfitobacteriaceae bacterium]
MEARRTFESRGCITAMLKYLIVVACGTNITSTTVAGRVREMLKTRGFDVETKTMRAPDVPAVVDQIKPDMVIFTGKPPTGLKCPVIEGVPFLTGVGKEEALARIVDVLQKPHWAGKERR